MNLKQLIIFGIENSSEPVIKNPILRAALEEPGSMVGTPTKEVTQHGRRIFETPEGNVSEKSTTFFLNGQWMNVPSIHEGRAFTDDQLRRMIKEGTIQPTSVHGSRVEAETAAGQRSDMMKSHTRGFDDGGRIGFEEGNDVDVPKWKRTTNYLKTQEARKKGLVWNKETKTMDQPKHTQHSPRDKDTPKKIVIKKKKEFVERTKHGHRVPPKKEGFVWDKKEKVFRKRKIKATGTGVEFEKKLLELIDQGDINFETQGHLIERITGSKDSSGNIGRVLDKHKDKFTFKRKSRLGGDEALKNEKILEYFNNQEPGSKIKVERAVKDINKNLPKTEQISETIIYNRLKDTKFNTTFLGSHTLGSLHGQLSDGMKQNIIDAFGDDLGITMEDFAKKGKYGVNATTDINQYEAIRRFVEGGKWDVAYNVGAADGWLLESFNRAGYKPLKEIIRGVEKTIGYEAPDGTKWYGAKKWATKHNGKQVKELHPGWKRVDDLVSIVKETRVAPSQAIMDLLSKGSGIKNINGLSLERLVGYLLDETDVKDIKKGLSTFHKHHVKGITSPAEDIQLVTRVANQKAKDAVEEIDRLKAKNIPIDYDAIDTKLKNYGVTIEVDGKRLGGKGFESKADIEKWATKKIGTWKQADFEKFAKQFIKNEVKFASFPANIGAMWKSLGSGARKTLGWGTAGLSELVFMGLDMKNEMSKGKSTEEAASIAKRNASLGIYSDDAYLKELIKVGDDMDIDTRAFEKVFRLNELGHETNKYFNRGTERIKALRELGQNKAADDLQKNLDMYMERQTAAQAEAIEGIAGQVSISKAGEVFPSPNLDQIAESRYTLTNEEFAKAFTDVQEAGIEKLKKEKTKAFDVQSKQVDPEAGSIGDPLIDFGFNVPAWHWKSILGVEEAPHLKERRHIKEMLEFSPQELYRYNLARGVDPDQPITQESFQNLIYEQPGLGFAGAEGGIASLLKKK